MTLTQLRYFREIVRLGGFTKAANKLFISQSTLSKSIRALEDEYKVILINRGAKNFEVTKEGMILYDYAERICSFYEDVYKRQHFIRGNIFRVIYLWHSEIRANLTFYRLCSLCGFIGFGDVQAGEKALK